MIDWDVETDVLVAGAGGCGLVAALSAREHGARVTLLEKRSDVGGTTAMSGGSIVGAGTDQQRAAGIDDSPEAFAEDVLGHGDEGTDPELTLTLAEQSRRTLTWLEREVGVDLRVNDGPYGRHGHQAYRRHWLVGDGGDIERNGQALVDALLTEARERGVEIVTDHPVTDLVFETDAIVGVEAGKNRTERVRARKVLLATGGFGANPELRAQRIPDGESLLYWGDDGSTGDGIRLGQEGGAEIRNMASFLGFPTIARPEGVFVPWEVSKEGAFVVDGDGRRFGDAGACAYSEFAATLWRRPEGTAYLVFDGDAFDAMASQPSTRDRWRNCRDQGVFNSADTVSALASTLDIDPGGLAETVRIITASRSADRLANDGYTRTVRRELQPPFYGTEIEPAILQTQGGLVVDDHGHVLGTDGARVRNLYAGGGAAASVSGHRPEGYLSGNGLLTALNLGRLMGDDAGRAVATEV